MPDEPRPEKVAVVEDVSARLSAASAAILTEYRGLKVKEMESLRRALRAAGGEYKIYKNTLVRRAAAESGLGALEPLLEGPTAIVFVDDDVASVAKALREFSRATPALVVKGGLLGRDLLDAKGANALADLPSREVLLAQFAGALAAPLRNFAGLLKALPQNLAYGLSALIEKMGGAPVEGIPASADGSAGAPEAGEAETVTDAETPAEDEPVAAPEAEAEAGEPE